MGPNLKKRFLLVSEKQWHDQLFINLNQLKDSEWYRINSKDDFTVEKISLFNPDFIFIPHWSYIISADIYENFQCIVFHMTDLPFGRGGSPLQNLIVRGFRKTMISAIKVEKGIDTGPVYCKEELSLDGSAKEIFMRASIIIEGMINRIVNENIQPLPQFGEIVEFRRRKPDDSNLAKLSELEILYDYIRMLDCEGYPEAFVETEHFRFEFTNANLTTNQSVTANVRIIKK